MTAQNTYDLIVVGAGITGESVAYHASRLGVGRIAVVDPGTFTPYPLGALISAPIDLFTRYSHNWGVPKAAAIRNFYGDAYSYTIEFILNKKIPHKINPLFRVLLTPQELAEAEKASVELGKIQIQSHIEQNHPGFPNGKFSGVLTSGEFMAQFSPSVLRDELLKHYKYSRILNSASSLKRIHGSYQLSMESGDVLTSPFVVLANHLSIPSLLGALTDAFVPTVEDAFLWRISGQDSGSEMGVICNYGHEWFMKADKDHIIGTGARFLRKHGGVSSDATPNPKIEQFLRHRIEEIFGANTHPELIKEWRGLECRPCDELPIIGPMFGETGVLIASGFMNQGYSLGFYSGKILAELLVHGRSELLPKELLPSRFRSLPSADLI